MTDDGSTGGWESLPRRHCRSCVHDVPAGAFCAVCGAQMSPQSGQGTGWLRMRAHAAAPDEHVMRPSLSTTLFPRVPRNSRSAFRAGLVVLVVLLVVFAWLKAQPPLIGISALGLPLLFIVYLRETDAFVDLDVRTLALAAAVSTGIGIGWAFATHAIWARTYDDVLATPMTTTEVLINLVAVPVGGVLLLLAPVAALRRWRPGVRESLDGFVIGAVAALCYTAAQVLTRAAPEFTNGLVSGDYPSDALFASAAIRGVAAPLTAIAVGGMVGTALWMRPRTDSAPVRHWYSPSAAAPAVGIGLLAYVGQNAIDYAWISYGQIVGLYAAITVLALLALRFVLHCTLLGEVADGISPDEPVLCPQCHYVVPDLAFCANCGIAANAASRSSRRGRRLDRPIPAGLAPDGR